MRAPWNWRDLAIKVLLVYWWIVRPRTVGVRGIICDEQGRLLFVKHSYGSRYWYLPGGGSDGAESANESMVREFWEETGLKVEVTKLVGVYLWEGAYKRDHIFVFECKQIGGVLKIDRGEIAEADWFALHQLPQSLQPGMPQVLQQWKSGVTGYGRWPEEEG